MSKISIDLDLAVVQEALHAKVQPAVDKILAKYDLPALVAAELEKKPPKEDSYGMVAYRMAIFGGYGGGTVGTVLESLISQSIQESAKEYVAAHLKKERVSLETAFEKMLAGSKHALCQAFLRSLESGLEHDWSFEIETTVAVKEPEQPDYRDD